jgi:hypothetical protein
MMNPSDSHHGGEGPYQDTQQEGHQDRKGHVGLTEVNLPGKTLDQSGVGGRAGLDRPRSPALASPEILQALEEHVGADSTQHEHVGDGDDEIGLSQHSQQLDEKHLTELPAMLPISSTMPILKSTAPALAWAKPDAEAATICWSPRRRRRWAAIDHDEEGRKEEAAADAEETREEADETTQAQQQGDVECVSRYRQVDREPHHLPRTARCEPSAFDRRKTENVVPSPTLLSTVILP